MRSWVIGFLIFFSVQLVWSQECPDLIDPLNGSNDVPVNASLSWEAIEGVTGYIISLGTSPGSGDLVDEQPTGLATSFTPPQGLPENTIIYVTITLFFFNQPDIVCPSQSFQTEDVDFIPDCTALNSPLDGSNNINVATNISWDYVYGATGYLISIGTAPGLFDIVDGLDLGNALTYDPPADLPAETEIFVLLVPYNENGNAVSCLSESFTTMIVAALPGCSELIYPVDGEINVPLSPLIEWEEVPGAEGYTVYIGTSPFENDVLDGGVFITNSTFVLNFEANSIYFIRIVPFNSSGNAIGCDQTSFSTILGCGPFFDPETAELITLNPVLNFPDQVGICLNQSPAIINATDDADGYRWYAFNSQGEAIQISDQPFVEIEEEGIYRYEAYRISEESGFAIECSSFKDFEVVSSEAPVIEGVNLTESGNLFTAEIIVSGMGDYEYAAAENGPYQDSNILENLPSDTQQVFVRDRNGCGIAAYNLENLIIKKGFPLFFTPNNDGYNDEWQFVPSDEDDFQLEVIYIFNRYGKLIKTLSPYSQGWTGDFKGERLPETDYWYRAVTTDGRSITGHFALRRN